MSNNSPSNETPYKHGRIKASTQSIPSDSAQRPLGSLGVGSILLSLAIVSIPLAGFSGALLALVFRYRVTQSLSPFPDLQLDGGENDASYYYVNFPATRLVFIASWSSSVAPTLVSFLMALALFPAAKKLFNDSKSQNGVRNLPTPYQYALFLGLLNGKLGELWRVFKYSRWRNHARSFSGLKSSLIIFILATLLSLLIVAADTILHITTSTVPFVQISSESSPTNVYGKGLTEYCLTFNSSDNNGLPCTISSFETATLMTYSTEIFQTYNNVSNENQIFRVPNANTSEGDFFFLGAPLSQLSPSIDFKASTVGIITTCSAISQKCNLSAPIGASTPFHCSSGFFGDLQSDVFNTTGQSFGDGSDNFVAAIYKDPDLTDGYQPPSLSTTNDISSALNPFYLGVAATVQGTQFTSLYNDSEIVHPEHGGNSFVLGCSIETVDLTYSWLNSSASIISYAPTNGSVAVNFLAPLGQQTSTLGQAVSLAGVQDSATELAHSFARSFSFLSMSLLAGAYDSRANIEEQTRGEFLVTKVSKASLLALIGCNLLFSVFGLVLAFWALCCVSKETRGLEGRVSMLGLVQSSFESEAADETGEMEDFFEEKKLGEQSKRVGVVRTSKGLQLTSFGT